MTRINLLCYTCKENEAKYLLIWKKYYKDSNLEGWYNPELICHECVLKFLVGKKLYEYQPCLIQFERIALLDPAQIGYMCSNKDKEVNHLNSAYWKKKLFHIKKLTQARLSKKGEEDGFSQSV